MAYTASNGVHIVNEDGSGDYLFVANASQPAWAPSGDKLAVVIGSPDCPDTRVVRLDGTVEASYIGCDPDTMGGLSCCYGGPAWAPDGSIIVRHWQDMEVDPTTCEFGDPCPAEPGPPRVGQGLRGAEANWKPDASEYAIHTTDWGKFSSGAIEVLNARGDSIVRQLTPSTSFDTSPAWSPDGSKIAFVRSGSIQMMDASDGSGITSLGAGGEPDWQPVPNITPSAFPGPRGATPMRLSLVPAYQQCTAPNSTHGAPLAYPSCTPPRRSPNVAVTLGVGDGTPPPAKSIGSLTMKVKRGAPGPPDDSDVLIQFTMTNVINSNGSDYTDKLGTRAMVRLTDRPGGIGATTQDFPFEFEAPCTGTADATLGGTCEVATSADTVIPGAIPESVRTLWALDRVHVYSMAAGYPLADPDRLLAVQGIFVP
jgi:hypothetical protein